jgi:hypothetical protein
MAGIGLFPGMAAPGKRVLISPLPIPSVLMLKSKNSSITYALLKFSGKSNCPKGREFSHFSISGSGHPTLLGVNWRGLGNRPFFISRQMVTGERLVLSTTFFFDSILI